jgi:hypothetical protein
MSSSGKLNATNYESLNHSYPNGELMIPFEFIYQWNIVCLFRRMHKTKIVKFFKAEISMPSKLAGLWMIY